MLSTGIESTYNQDWKIRVFCHMIRCCEKYILKGEFLLLREVKFAKYKISDIPGFVYQRVTEDEKPGCSSTCIVL
jgi:hypothetical protein